jgi:hypothetical protein
VSRCARRRSVGLGAVVVSLAVGSACSVANASVEIGQAGVPASPITCGGGSWVQDSTGAPPGFAVPAGGGSIAEWRTGATSGTERLKVFRRSSDPAHPEQFLVVGQSAPQVISSGNQGPFPINPGIAVAAGDIIGFAITGGGAAACEGNSPGDNKRTGPGDPAPGTTWDAGGIDTNIRLNIAARVEPDTDRDGFGDETQDACPGVFGSINGCPKADVALTKTASQGAESDLVTYTLVAKNNGPDPVPDAVVSDAPPAGAHVVAANGPGGPCTASGATLRCGMASLASGATGTVTIVARLKAGSQTNTASVTSAALTLAATKATGAGDPNPANNTATATVNVASPAVSNTNVSPSTFRLGSLLPTFTRKPPVGTTISFKLSEPARATLTFSQPTTGRKVGRSCKTLTRANRKKHKCTIPNVRGILTVNAHAGTNKVRFQGRLSRTKKLKPGRYTLTITATDSAGNRSNAKAKSFTIVR